MRTLIELENGNFYYFERRGNKLVAGSICNWGVIPLVEIDYDLDETYEGNLERLYEAVVEFDIYPEDM